MSSLKTPVLIALLAWVAALSLLAADFVLYEIDNQPLEVTTDDSQFTGNTEAPTLQGPDNTGTEPPPPPAPTFPRINRIGLKNAVFDSSVHLTQEFRGYMQATIAQGLGILTFAVTIMDIYPNSIEITFTITGMTQDQVRDKYPDILFQIQTNLANSPDYNNIDTSIVELETYDDSGFGYVNTIQANTDSPTTASPTTASPTTASPTTASPTTKSPTAAPTFERDTIDFDGTTVKTPNIIVILADDMGWGDVSAYWDTYPTASKSDWQKTTGWRPGDGINSNPCADSSRWTSAGAAGQDYPIVDTPNLNSLADEGILFNNFHSGNPVCTPTRAAILSGRLPGRDKIDYVDDTGKNQMQQSAYGVSDSESEYCLPQGTWTTATAAKEKGYVTGFFGKWHLGNLHNSKSKQKYDNTPIDYGFDEYAATTTNAATHDVTIHAACKESQGYTGAKGTGHYGTYGNHDNKGMTKWSQSVDHAVSTREKGQPFMSNNGASGTYDGIEVINGCDFPNTEAKQNAYDHTLCDQYYEPFSFITFGNDVTKDNCNQADNNIQNIRTETLGNSAKYLTTKALDFIDRKADGGKVPFFIEICTWHMHTPFTGSDDGSCQGSGIPCTGNIYNDYKGSVWELDEAIGHLRNGLQSRDMLEDTIIIFTTDNGQETSSRSGGSSGPYSGCKRELHEGGVRVPGLLSWPRVMTNKYFSNRPSAVMDILPTMEDLFSTLSKDITFDTNLYDKNGQFFRNRAGVDGESFYDLLVTASRNTVDQTTIQTDDDDAANLRDAHLMIAQQGNGPWVVYSKDGQYKYRTDDQQVYDLIAEKQEVIVYTGSDSATIKTELQNAYNTRRAEYDSDRSVATANKNDPDWHLCFGQ